MEEEKNSYCSDDTFIPIFMFPEGKNAINKTLPIWNFSVDNFFKEQNVYGFIVASLTKWISDEILTRYCNYFWRETIINAFEFHKNRVNKNFIELIKERVGNII